MLNTTNAMLCTLLLVQYAMSLAHYAQLLHVTVVCLPRWTTLKVVHFTFT
jgi:hypothetical protein